MPGRSSISPRPSAAHRAVPQRGNRDAIAKYLTSACVRRIMAAAHGWPASVRQKHYARAEIIAARNLRLLAFPSQPWWG